MRKITFEDQMKIFLLIFCFSILFFIVSFQTTFEDFRIKLPFHHFIIYLSPHPHLKTDL